MAHPIWRIMEHQGRTLEWLARRIGYSSSHVRNVKLEIAEPVGKFRAACAVALDLPESVLFLSEECPSDGQSFAPSLTLTDPRSSYQPDATTTHAEQAEGGQSFKESLTGVAE